MIVDAGQRAAALDPARSFIVQAPAGSGKTELLTQRLLVLLAGVDEPEEVVAMTFTRKAAAEMRHRVFAAIRAASKDPSPQDAHRRRTWTLARAVLERSQARGWRLEDSPQRLRVQTIDSLCAQIVQLSPLTAGAGGRVKVTEFAEPLYREAARALIESIEADAQRAAPVLRVLRHFDNRVAVLEAQLVGLLGRRDQWLRLVTQEQRAERPREVLEAALEWVVRDALARADAVVPEALRAAWLASAVHASAQRYAAEPELPLHALRDAVWPAPEPEQLERWRALLDLVFKQDDGRGWRQTVNAAQGFPAGRTKAEKAELGPARDAHLRLIAELRATPGAHEALTALYTLPAPRYSDAQWEVLQALLDTLRLAAAHLRVIFAARGEMDFAEVAAQAVAALGDAEQPSDLALRFDYRVRHLLVDEFQDTSVPQWQLLLRLTRGWSEGDGRTLFVVGDPMQSIYRFREADVGLYLRAWRDGIGTLPLHPLRLSCNFRSQAGVVDWVNTAFAQVLPAQADLNRSAVPYSAASATCAASMPAVEVHAFVDAGPRAEAQRVLDILRECAPDERVAILVRGRGHLAGIAPALRAAGIAYRAVDIESLGERPVIEELRALTWALLHPMDRAAWLAVLRAPWCGLTLADLHVLAAGLPAQESLLAALRDPQRLARTSADGRERLARTMPQIEAALAEQGRRPLRRLIESLWTALGGAACAQDDSALADAAVFFDCLQRLAPGDVLADFAQLDLALAELKATPDPAAGERLSLMTIHKSKGLEFDTVIVPGLGRGTRSDAPPLIAWAHLSDVDGEDRLLLAPVHATGEERDPSFDYMRALEADKQRFEDARLLYVAATRARQRLHLIGEVGRDSKGGLCAPPARSLLARLWPAVETHFIAAAEQTEAPAVQDGAVEDRPVPMLRRLVDWTPPPSAPGLPVVAPIAATPAEALRFDWAGEVARCVGVVYHRWVQHIAEDGIDGWDAARCGGLDASLAEDLRHEGVPAPRAAEAAARVRRALENTVADARGRWLLDRGHREAVSELAVSTVLGDRLRRLRIDRSFVDAQDRRWIVDFKTSVHEGGDVAGFVRRELERYRGQLEEYRSALQRLDARPVRAALYLPLIDAPELRWVELDG